MRLPTRDLLRLSGVLGVLGAVATSIQVSGLRWQHTESLPRGLYRLDRNQPIVRGSIVLWCLDERHGRWARDWGYLTRGRCPGDVEALGKVVLAVAGDMIDWQPDGVRLNGRLIPRTEPVLQDRAGRRLDPVAYGRYIVSPGTAWLYSPYSVRSLDSRYFGPQPVDQAVGVAKPVWIVDR
jgi:conjugative transfer signal peptidase TraF